MANLLPQSYRRDKDYHVRRRDSAAREAMPEGGRRPLDVSKLIRRFGGPRALQERLTRRGCQISLKAIEKWRDRGRMSSDWLNELALIADEENEPLILSEYVIGAPKRLPKGSRNLLE